MAKQKEPQESEVPKGYTRLIKTGADGGYLDVPEKDVKRLLSLEKRMGVENYKLPASDGDSGSDKDKSDMAETQE